VKIVDLDVCIAHSFYARYICVLLEVNLHLVHPVSLCLYVSS